MNFPPPPAPAPAPSKAMSLTATPRSMSSARAQLIAATANSVAYTVPVVVSVTSAPAFIALVGSRGVSWTVRRPSDSTPTWSITKPSSSV